MYTPGKMIFSIAKSLVEKGKKVQVISLGKVDDKFVKLIDQYLVSHKHMNPKILHLIVTQLH